MMIKQIISHWKTTVCILLIGGISVVATGLFADNTKPATEPVQKVAQKVEQKVDQKVAQKVEQKVEQKVAQKVEQKVDQKVAQKVEQKKPVQRQTQQQRLAKIPVQRQGKIGTQWQVGDRWVIETKSLQSQSASEKPKKDTKVQWRFTVVKREQINKQDVFRVNIECLDTAAVQPEVTIWVDCKSGALVRTTSRMPIKGEWKSFTETYISANGTPTPVFGALPALPIDLPLFNQNENHVKSLEPTFYQIISGTPENKSIEGVSFSFEIDQQVSQPEESRIKSIDNTLPSNETVEVKLRGAGHEVHQVWSPGNPWPVFSNNGTTESELIDFEPAAEPQE